MSRFNQETSAMREFIDTSSKQDEKPQRANCITVLELRGVQITVIGDNRNNCLKSFYNKKNKVYHSRLQLNGLPSCIAQLEENKVMVALPVLSAIITVAVTPDLIHENHMNTREKYNSLAVISPSRLAAGSRYQIDILNMQGEVMKSITNTKHMDLFISPHSMCVTNTGHLLVSDWWKRRVTCLTSRGQVAWIYSGTGEEKLNTPIDVTTSREGDIFVADNGLKKVIQLSPTGAFVRDLLTPKDGLTYPVGIYVDSRGTLSICDDGQVFRFVFLRNGVQQL